MEILWYQIGRLLEGRNISNSRRKRIHYYALTCVFSLGVFGQDSMIVPMSPDVPAIAAEILPGSTTFQVDTTSRAAVRDFFNAVYFSSAGVRSEWNGNVVRCDAGNTSAEYQAAVLARINFFRAMAGVPADIRFSPELSAKARQAALVVSANLSISHDPAETFSCFTLDGAEAAAVSNLALGTSGIDSIEAYMLDAGNNYRVGHRRWMLYPQTQVMGNGDIDPPDGSASRRANANWVIDSNFWNPRPATRDGFVAWPPPGFVPYNIVYPRWSFSFHDADFSSATVAVNTNGKPLPVRIEQLERGYGENTLVFVPGGMAPEIRAIFPKPDRDITYTVTINGVTVDKTTTNFTYSVTIFDPAAPDDDNQPILTGPSEPELGRSNRFLSTTVENATGYEFRYSTLMPYRRVELGDSSSEVTANISALYPLVQNSIFASSNAAFHLAHTTPARPQILDLNRIVVPSAQSELRFQSRLGAASTGQVARVLVSADDGSSWSELFSQEGDGFAGELSFKQVQVKLGAFADRAIRIRFEYGFTFGELTYAPGTSDQIGWYIDDIGISSAYELTPKETIGSTRPEFQFNPPEKRSYYLDVRPLFAGDFHGSWSRSKIVTATEPATIPALVRVLGIRPISDELEVEFEPSNTRATAVYNLEQAESLNSEWTVVDPASLQETQTGSRRFFRLNAGRRNALFYRVTIE